VRIKLLAVITVAAGLALGFAVGEFGIPALLVAIAVLVIAPPLLARWALRRR
jgi:hypothetical protein